MSDWRSMSTAPEDGTLVLLCAEYDDDDYEIFTGSFLDPDGDAGWGYLERKVYPEYVIGWMPLPDPPEQSV